MDAFFTDIGKRPEYLGNYTGSSYEIRLADFYNKKLAAHEKCSQLFQKFAMGVLCIMNSGLAQASGTGFALDYSDAENLKVSAAVPQKMLDGFAECRYSFVLQMMLVKLGKAVIDNYKNSEKDEEKLLYEAKTFKEIPLEYLSFASQVEKYFAEFESNSHQDNEQSLFLVREIALFSLKGVLKKDPFYRDLLVQYEVELIAYLENLSEEDFDWAFGAASPENSSRRSLTL